MAVVSLACWFWSHTLQADIDRIDGSIDDILAKHSPQPGFDRDAFLGQGKSASLPDDPKEFFAEQDSLRDRLEDRRAKVFVASVVAMAIALAVSGWKLLLYCVRELARAARAR